MILLTSTSDIVRVVIFVLHLQAGPQVDVAREPRRHHLARTDCRGSHTLHCVPRLVDDLVRVEKGGVRDSIQQPHLKDHQHTGST